MGKGGVVPRLAEGTVHLTQTYDKGVSVFFLTMRISRMSVLSFPSP